MQTGYSSVFVGASKGATATKFVDVKEVVKAVLARIFPAAFRTSENFHVNVDLVSTVGLDYFHRRPFEFNGKIEKVQVQLN